MKEKSDRSFSSLFSIKGVFTPYTIAVMGMLAAVKVVLTLTSTIHLTPSIRLTNFNYLANVVVGFFFGPVPGLMFGAVTDIVTFIVKPAGPFNIGYTISEMVMCFIYGCFLYKSRPVRLWQVVAARAIIIVFVFFGLNFIWDSVMYGRSAGSFYNTTRIINNLIQFPIHIALSFGACKLSEQVEKSVFKKNKA